ncbi:dicarboxylate/amino acid:cation symporter [Sphingopyxis alaskensis]|jgi:DAACS family dicarboxylate/amino acid:cation (Na+ or H+) symporter|uniref:Sodium:dicarboxylate symporter n=2 Tax=Sphingopyxis alaskensis TaxID=117207 RepID=Q1GVE0_SPHAL|nr:dicarboxylate/amino acid:cation symporter [Sphingopyxis alaskensis]ABF52382.1 sodium:dicarboxylate symporter [Sphingopyxis alaskensis RB2256]MCM3420344.1 dicarboxylate/amino acid:cation symporter [Sphingopyxis alaskensis]
MAEASIVMPAQGHEEARARRLQWRMLVGFVVGLLAGLAAHYGAAGQPWVDEVIFYLGKVGDIFLRLLFMLVIPLLVSALIVGVAEMGEMRALKTVGLRTLIYTIVVSSIAVVISLLVVNLLQPGAGVDPEVARSLIADGAERAGSIIQTSREAKAGADAIVAIVPNNFFLAMSQNDVLAVMFFALFFGIGLMMVQTPQTQALKTAIEGVFEVAMKLIGLVIRLAPIAIFCFMFNLGAQFGVDLLVRLSAFVGVVLLALGLQMFVVFPILLKTLAGKSPIAFFRETQEATVMAFSTASSNATLPTALRVARNQLHLPDRVARFVLTIGATANQNGTAMFEGVTVIFLAQFFGVDLTLQQQIMVMAVCILGGIGTAGVPAGSLPVIALILAMVGVPPAGIGLVLGVDRFLDMCRTTLNVIGDLVAATVVSAGIDDRPEGDSPG